jgi:hypothetical protein
MSVFNPQTNVNAQPYVVSINRDVAQVVMPDGRVQEVPTARLPPGQQAQSYIMQQDDSAAFAENSKSAASPYNALAQKLGGNASSQQTGGMASGSTKTPSDFQRLMTMLGPQNGGT